MSEKESEILSGLVSQLEVAEENIKLLDSKVAELVLEISDDDSGLYYEELSKAVQDAIRSAAIAALREEVGQIKRAIREAAV